MSQQQLISSSAAAAGAAGGGILIQEVFSTTLYTGNSSTQTITNNIDLDGEGGLVWLKQRNSGNQHLLLDSVRGVFVLSCVLNSSSLNPASNDNNPPITNAVIQTLNTTGFTLGSGSGFAASNSTNSTYCSWTFRKAPKFFDVVGYTGTGANRTVSHNLGSVPGSIIVKRVDTSSDWQVYHRANTASPETDYLVLNTTAATADSNTRWNDTQPTDAVFSLGTEVNVNASGEAYIAYLFAHDDGGFGSGIGNGISCASYTGNGSATGPTVALGYEPQWLMIKRTDSTGDWIILDSKRDVSNPRDKFLEPNTSDAEATGNDVDFNATSFQLKTTSATVNASGGTYIYIAIRADM